VQLSIFETTRRKTDETYDNRTCYNFRTLRHVRTRADHGCSDDWDERYSNRLVNEPHGERDWHDRLYRPEQGQERFREYAHAQPFAKRINITPTGPGSGLRR
jgi:diadenosine tetraphosphatase ApaH/serine/threonine PP2A family protein phosphatase